MRSTTSNLRALLLVFVFTVASAPTASARVRAGDEPGFQRGRIVHIVNKLLKAIGIAGNSDQFVIPRP
jgi:hypothetical protein